MGTKLSKVPANEEELNKLLQNMYETSARNYKEDRQNNFTGLLEIITSEPNIISAIRKIKSKRKGRITGNEGMVTDEYLSMSTNQLLELIKDKFRDYHPEDLKRIWINKTSENIKDKKRKIGISTSIDQVVQECIRNVLEPIAEGQFFIHSYGFRPMRSAEMAVARIKHIQFHAKCNWVIEGDIKGCFDNINHSIMIRSLWNIGIRDRRVLAIIKEMLAVGVENECETTELGIAQGNILSPLLANIYLNRFDQFITGDFETKKLRKAHSRHDGAISAMRNHSNLKTCYYVRYGDDWVILTDSRETGLRLKYKAEKYLRSTLKLETSENKTMITNVRTTAMRFLGVELRLIKRNGIWINKVQPDRKRLEEKLRHLKREIFYLRKVKENDRDRLVQNIFRVNSIILGLINYYKMCDQINVVLRVPSWRLKYTAYKSLKRYGGVWIQADQVSNMIGLNKGHKAHLPAIQYKDTYIGITDLNFSKWVNPTQKNQQENPYTEEGRQLYAKRMRRKRLDERVDEVNSDTHALFIRMAHSNIYSFEYYINRPYVYKRDKGKCRICNGFIEPNEVRIHHINPKLESTKLNKKSNLISVHSFCHNLIHNEVAVDLSVKALQNLEYYRKKLAIND